VRLLPPKEAPLSDYREREIVQVRMSDGSLKCWRTAVESIRKSSDGKWRGYVHYQEQQWRVRLTASGEWIGVDENDNKIDITHWMLEEELTRKEREYHAKNAK
jgi:hypothetical protein